MKETLENSTVDNRYSFNIIYDLWMKWWFIKNTEEGAEYLRIFSLIMTVEVKLKEMDIWERIEPFYTISSFRFSEYSEGSWHLFFIDNHQTFTHVWTGN